MANLNVSNKHNLKLYINNDEYWDFYVSKDSYACYGNIYDGSSLHDKCLISYIDMADDDCLLGDGWVCSNGSYHWDDAIAVGNTLYNISYVGVDNGLFTYRKDRITNKDFIEFFKDKKYVIEVSPSVTNGAVRRSMKLVTEPTAKKNRPMCFILSFRNNRNIELINATKNTSISLIDLDTINMFTESKPIAIIIPLTKFIFLHSKTTKVPAVNMVSINSTILIPS